VDAKLLFGGAIWCSKEQFAHQRGNYTLRSEKIAIPKEKKVVLDSNLLPQREKIASQSEKKVAKRGNYSIQNKKIASQSEKKVAKRGNLGGYSINCGKCTIRSLFICRNNANFLFFSSMIFAIFE